MSQKNSVVTYILAYGCWAISTLISVLVLYLGREAILLALFLAGSPDATQSELFYRSYRVGAVANWSILFIGIAVIALLVTFEHLYRNSVPEGKLAKHFFLVSWIELGLLFLVHLVYYLLYRAFAPLTSLSYIILMIEAAAALMFWWLWYTRRKEPVHEQS